MDIRDITSARLRGSANEIISITKTSGYTAANIVASSANIKVNSDGTNAATIAYTLDGIVYSATLATGQYGNGGNGTFVSPNTSITNAAYYGGAAILGGGYLGSPDVVSPPMGVGSFTIPFNNGFYGNPVQQAFNFITVPRPQSINISSSGSVVECLLVFALDVAGSVRVYQGAPYIKETSVSLYANANNLAGINQNMTKYRGIRVVRDDVAMAYRYEIESALADRSNSFLPVDMPNDCVPFAIGKLTVGTGATGDFVPGTTTIDGTNVALAATWLTYTGLPAVTDLQ